MEETIGYSIQIDGDEAVNKALNGAIRNAGIPVFKTEEAAREYGETMVETVVMMGRMLGREVTAEVVTVEVFFATEDA